ncbi:hypothetical protein PHSY_003053 [Pseudozyma hubeiensis SY62]|uniref:Uncharacterized protein n=1 Tax=Pseudozyma hubeiensis (strain SY62) TaxID=1305764 RepID=R9P2M9_PSEHS|nr:hypothetical protein PHSY_003053 [Pseudozyma hubeiensis SY62]GAC95477.1 hypothetical protein PHSY_003053 [Pseudozyma hubeiensis SY62]
MGRFSRKNSSVVSLTSSSNEGFEAETSRGTSMYNSQSGSSRGHGPSQPVSPCSPNPPLASAKDGTSDTEYTKSSLFGRRRGSSVSKTESESHDSSFTKFGTASTKSGSSGVGTFRGLGRRLFNRSSSNLKPGSSLPSRSHSASSDSTQAHSPPLTPTTPPPLQIQPVWLPNGQKDFFSNFSSLPSSVDVPAHQSHGLRIPSDTTVQISPKTSQSAFFDLPSSFDSGREHSFDAGPSNGHASTSTSSHSNTIFSSPISTPRAAAQTPSFSNTLSRREIPAVIEEEADSDFLRAVLDFGEREDTSPTSPSYRGGRAAPLPTRSSSLGQIAGIASIPSYATSSSTPRPPMHRTPDGRMVLTQKAAKDFEAEVPTPRYVVVQRKFRKGLFKNANDSESEDEYGNEENGDDGDATVVGSSSQATSAGAQQEGQTEAPTRFPSSFAKSSSRTHSPANDGFRRQAGLDSAAKKALYNCTLLKVHMHLAPTLASDEEARTLIPIIAAGEVLYSNEDLKFPRSINSASKLQQHTSTHGFARSLQVALARTAIMRKLRRDKLSIDQEVEISWFQRRYGSAGIPAEHIAKALRQRQMVSPEALAKAPIAAAPHDSGVAIATSLASSRKLSSIVGVDSSQKHDKNGIVAWAQRPSFMERHVEVLPADEFAPGEVIVAGAAKLAPQPGMAQSAPLKSTVSFSPRIRVLAGLPSVQEEKHQLDLMLRLKEREARRAARRASPSDGGVWEGPDRRASSVSRSLGGLQPASPSNKQKRLPPWMVPPSPQLLSPQYMGELRTSRSASDAPATFSMLHQNGSATSIPEVKEPEEQAADSSDEEVPLAHLQTFRAHRSAEKERIHMLEHEIALLKHREGERDRDEEDRKAREEEARRIEAERAYEERKAALDARKMERNRRILQEARERRGFTRQSVLLAEPNYGAGNPLLSPHHKLNPGSSPSSPNLAAVHEQASSSVARAMQHDASLNKLQGNRIAPSAGLYTQQEGQRRSKTSVVAAATSPIQEQTGPRIHPPDSAVSPLVDLHRNASMASLVAPAGQHSLPHQRSMAMLPTSPQITERRTSLKPLAHEPNPQDGYARLHPAQSMHHLAPHSPSMHHLSPGYAASPSMLSTSPTAGMMSPQPLLMDPRLSMSMTNLHAQAYLQAQHHAAHMANPVLQGQPPMAQTAKVSSRVRPRIPAPLVSLNGDVVPSSALSARGSR